ncbi:hypothetical protein MTBLM1_140018 [Rhodospirillaceae bacterium LM-1]|nr:hypothetical protein MTBLM1_140018 [Rhodospirillaceae bacterium LM-1]
MESDRQELASIRRLFARKTGRFPSRRKMLALEPRMMFDAAAVVTALDAASQDNHSDTTHITETMASAPEPPSPPSPKEIAFVSTDISGWQKLAEAAQDKGAEVITLDPGQDILEQMANALSGQHDVSALHIFTYGVSGAIESGGAILSAANLSQHQEELSAIGSSLTAQGDILLYGCNVADGPQGGLFVDLLGQYTGADIGASMNRTGSAGLGGDWTLEFQSGTINVQVITAPLFQGVLDGTTTLVSSNSSGIEANGGSSSPAISANGRYIVFESQASDLMAGDTNGASDIFVKDMTTGEITRVSVDSSGNEANGGSSSPAISSDGRYVVFASTATNLVSGDTNASSDIFIHDMTTGATTRVSVDSSENEQVNASTGQASVSSDGRYISFSSFAPLVAGDANNREDIFVRDTVLGTTTRVSVDSIGTQADDHSFSPMITPDGRYVVFASDATNLISGDTNGISDVFIHDVQTGTTTRISVDSSGNEANNGSYSPSISSDGRYVAFRSSATNLVAGDTNVATDIFLKDTQTGTLTRISVDSSGNEGNNGSTSSPAISGNGSYVVFDSSANNLVSGDTNAAQDIFRYEIQTGVTERISVDSLGNEANGISNNLTWGSISYDGNKIAFGSSATNLVSGDTNGVYDIFLRDLTPPPVTEPPAPAPVFSETAADLPPPPPPPPADTTPQPSLPTDPTADSHGDTTPLALSADAPPPPPPPSQDMAQAQNTVAADVGATVQAMNDAGLSRAEQVAVFESISSKDVVTGLQNSNTPAAQAAGAILARVVSGEHVSLAQIKSQLKDAGASQEDMMSYLLAYKRVNDEARDNLFSEAAALLAKGNLNPFTDAALAQASREAIPLGPKVAVLIGIDDYSNPIPKLGTPISDVSSVAAEMERKFGYDVKLLKNPSAREIVQMFLKLGAGMGENSNLVVYFAGHGYIAKDTGVGYWLPRDARADRPDAWISTKDIADFLAKVKARQTMVISDSCYSGSLTREYKFGSDMAGLKPADMESQRSVVVMSSGGEEPVVDAGFPGHSLFAGNFLKALDKAPKESIGFDLFNSVRKEVVKAAPQTPQYGALLSAGHKVGSDFVLSGQ